MIDAGYKKLGVYTLSHRLAIEVHSMSLMLPKHETYEEGSQIRRSSKSVCAQIVEGYSLRVYKKEFLLYLHRAYASAEETIEHLDLLHESNSLSDKILYNRLRQEYETLCGKLFRLIQSVAEQHESRSYVKEDDPPYLA